MSSPSSEQDNAAQIAYWNDRAGETWTTFQERLDALFEPLTALALAAAAPASGEHVIDIGCGCGATVLALADRVGPTGHILGVDVSEPMSARARQRIANAAINNAEVVVCDAAVHAFAPAGTDLLFSRFGVMFFADPVAAFVNLRHAMRPGGRLLCAAWRPLADNPWFSVPLEAARPILPPQAPADPNAPGPFAFANRERTIGIFSGAGWHDVQLTRHDLPMKFAETGQLEQATDFATRMGALARLLADVDAEVRTAVRLAVGKALQAYDSPGGINLTGSIWLISARA
jgi:SAM-dependent methyltransferase